MQTLGYFLKSEREKKNIRLEEVAAITKIQLPILKLMEEGNWKALPAKPFIKGFIVSYSRYVGINPEQAYQQYLKETDQTPQVISTAQTPSPSAQPETTKAPVASASELIQNSRTLNFKPIVFSLVGLVVLGISVWLINVGKESISVPPAVATATPTTNSETTDNANQIREVASVPDSKPAEPTQTTQEKLPPTSPVETSNGPHKLEVTSGDRSWIKVVIDEAPPIEYFLAPSEKATFSANQKIKVVLGNSVGSDVVYNGQKVEGTKFLGTIRSYIFPLNAKFPQDKANRRLSSDPDSLDKSDPTVESIVE